MKGDWRSVHAAEVADGRPTKVTERASMLHYGVPHLPTREDAHWRAGLARVGRTFDGWVGLYVADLDDGRFAGWNADARLPAASTVKLGVLAEGIRRFGSGRRSSIDYDLRQLGSWSSNLAANRVYELVGGEAPVELALHRLGMFSSSYPGPYRIGTTKGDVVKEPPPLPTSRVTTARDLGRALFRLAAAAARQRWALRTTGLTPAGARAALGYLSLCSRGTSVLSLPPGAFAAEKDGWTHETHASAAVVYLHGAERIVVVLVYRPGLTFLEARDLGAAVSRLALR